MHQIHISAASQLLEAALDEHKGRKRLAAVVGKRQDLISRWANGERKPGTKIRAQLEEILGIDWRLWDEPPLAEPAATVVQALKARLETQYAKLTEAAEETAPTFRTDADARVRGGSHAA